MADENPDRVPKVEADLLPLADRLAIDEVRGLHRAWDEGYAAGLAARPEPSETPERAAAGPVTGDDEATNLVGRLLGAKGGEHVNLDHPEGSSYALRDNVDLCHEAAHEIVRLRAALAAAGDTEEPERFYCVRPPLTMDVLYAIDEGRPIDVLYEGEWLPLAVHYGRDPLDFPRLLTDERFEWRWSAPTGDDR